MNIFRTTILLFATSALTMVVLSVSMPTRYVYKYKVKYTSSKIDREIMIVTGTYYNPTVGQCDDRPLETADGSIIRAGVRWVALSRDLLSRWGGKFNYGDTIYVYHPHKKLCGTWVVRDTMNKRFKDRIDFLSVGNELPGLSNGVLISKTRII
jgi:hypothetical protein